MSKCIQLFIRAARKLQFRSGSQSMQEPANKYSKIKKVIGIVSGKGGVGKSFVTASLAAALKKPGMRQALWTLILQGRLFRKCSV